MAYDPFAGGISGGLGNGHGGLLKGPDYGEVLNIYKKAGARVDPFMNLQLAEFRKALQAIMAGYGGARNELTRGADAARRDVITRGVQAQGGLTQNSLTRGLYRTSALGQGMRGITADTNQSLLGLSSNLATARAGLSAQEGNAIAGARYNIGNIYPSWLNNKNNLSLSKAQMLAQILGQQSDPLTNALGAAGSAAQIAALFA